MEKYARGFQLFEKMMESIGCSVLCFGKDEALTLKFAGTLFYKLLGYDEDEVTALLEPGNSPILRNQTPIDWKAVAGEIRQNEYDVLELKLIKKDGHHLWVQFRVSLMADDDGTEYFCGIIYDITLQRRSRRLAKEQAEELRALTMNVPGGVLRNRCDEFLTMDLISDGFCRLTGYTRDEITERFHNKFLNMVCKKDRELLQREARIEKNGITELTYGIIGRDGHRVWVLDKAKGETDDNGQNWVYRVLIDITERKKAQDELEASEERYRLILENAADPILDFDLRVGRLYYSPAFFSKFGNKLPGSREVIHNKDIIRNLKNKDLVHEADQEHFFSDLKKIISGVAVEDGEYRLKTVKGNYIWCNLHYAFFYDQQGAVCRLIAVISDIDKRKKETMILREKAEHDLLTGLFNRITTTNLIDDVIAKSVKGERHALFVIDIDNFKNVNDNMGHLCGDQLIVETARQIKKQFRDEDIVGRIGGDEFVVFLKNIVSVELIVKKAAILRKAFHEAKNPVDENSFVSGSIGVSFYPYDGTTYEELFQKADTAMYAAKKGGKDSFRIYTREIGDNSQI